MRGLPYHAFQLIKNSIQYLSGNRNFDKDQFLKIFKSIIDEYTRNGRKNESKIINFLDRDDDFEESFENIISEIFVPNIIKNQSNLKTFLYLLSNILNNHHRYPTFIQKMEKIFSQIQNQIKNYFSSYDIYKIFKKNPRFLLFLLNENIITINEEILNEMLNTTIIYLLPETAQKMKLIEDIPENYKEKQLIGENDDLISQLIRNDSIEEFIIYVNKNDYFLESKISLSNFETNHFLIKRQDETTLIEYAAFFGSTQIFKYLYKNNVELTSSLWLYAIHSDNAEMIYLLEENNVEPPNNSYKECIKESIKCHHEDITNYIQSNLMIENDIDKDDITSYCFQYYNFSYFPKEVLKNKINLYYACKYDYYQIVEYFIKNRNIDLTEITNNV